MKSFFTTINCDSAICYTYEEFIDSITNLHSNQFILDCSVFLSKNRYSFVSLHFPCSVFPGKTNEKIEGKKVAHAHAIAALLFVFCIIMEKHIFIFKSK